MTWHTALEDKSSAWVSEQSCAMSRNGEVYFVSEASRVIDGEQHHELGTARIFVSRDGGQSWTEKAKTTWADHSVSVIDVNHAGNGSRFYTFFNRLTSESGHGDKNPAYGVVRRSSVVGMFSFKDDANHVTEPSVDDEMGSHHYEGALPMKAIVLNDGSLLCLYYAGLNIGSDHYTMIGAVRTERSRLDSSEPVEIARAPAIIVQPEVCTISDFAAAYDGLEDLVYVAYPALIEGQCHLVLKTSSDGGTTWSKERDTRQPLTLSHRYYSPAMAFNHLGILGLMWRDEPVSDCWYFSASFDKGVTFTPAEPLSRCFERRSAFLADANLFLRVASNSRTPSDPSGTGSSSLNPVLNLNVIDGQDHVWRNLNSLAASPDGVFHPVWIEQGNGRGQMRTASVRVGSPAEKKIPSLQFDESKAADITGSFSLLQGSRPHYDPNSGTLTVRIMLRNRSDKPVRIPVLLQADALTSDSAQVQISNADNGLVGVGAAWNLAKAIPAGTLAPGATTPPYFLIFRITQAGSSPEPERLILQLRLKVLVPALCSGCDN